LVNLPIKIKFPIFVYFSVCELNKIFRNLCICLLCTVCVFFVYCFAVQIVEMAQGSAASSSDSVGVRRSQKVKKRCPKVFPYEGYGKEEFCEPLI
jgi:hypothetical protein